ncbi:hypothetical protein SRHO_G00322860 [Serrasalmus rhombeus]
MASIMEGPLSKWTNLMKGWQYRWFVLDYNAGLLSYYTSKDKMMRGSRRGCVRLRGAVIGIDDEDDSTFTITVDQKTFHFQARDADEREKWIHALEGTILRHALQLREAETAFVPSVQDFDKKLAEADAYLQILIDQLKLFDEKIKDCKDDEARRKIENLKETTCSMVESIKHCIVLLQIAKDQSNEQQHANGLISTINPVDGVYQPSPLDASVVSAIAMPTQTTLPTDGAQVCKAEQRPSSLPVGPVVTLMGSLQTPTPNSTGSGPSAPSSSVTSPSHMNVPPHSVPDFSYSSSEDEFYDADEFYQSNTSPKHCIDPSRTPAANSEVNAALKRPDTNESINSSMSNGTTDAALRLSSINSAAPLFSSSFICDSGGEVCELNSGLLASSGLCSFLEGACASSIEVQSGGWCILRMVVKSTGDLWVEQKAHLQCKNVSLWVAVLKAHDQHDLMAVKGLTVETAGVKRLASVDKRSWVTEPENGHQNMDFSASVRMEWMFLCLAQSSFESAI